MLTVGKSYSTKNGKTFSCEKDIGEIDTIFPFGGWVYNSDGSKDRFAYYTRGGTYKLTKSEYDLII
ncbi:hypothetical protein [Escherichia coli]|uniref:hypothetical protein n=1 Tax=Escherichia coli TaxID=562 RepID=UPI00033D17D6|nr:hypothetical protein [Escherichia coli]EOV49224.1 hypothetical protein A1SC_01592 [Escherichia sp. KTE52]EQN53402.1 hypothetical protein G693_02015 [Escherichia coli HVH 17 (4-7473087)]EQS04785.1 hypothetical protein G799_02081 [Escherichia coli HVH 141 (4-5995973)]EQS38197.1 hypothetical protein G804_01562 [Escherichia coli HVH 146 (4-3189767)]KAF3716072.1 hypothetical protein FM737_002897 [Escherichia marmotae]HAE7446090.1 hypothetical protein [Salmonella enterica]HBN3860683.1 hypotheti